MIGDLFSKLQEAREKIEEAKKKLNSITIEAESEKSEVKVTANANKMLTKIQISEDFKNSSSAEDLQELLLKTVNNALDEAARKGELEMKSITKDVLPNFPGLV